MTYSIESRSRARRSRGRPIVFIPSTLYKLTNAVEINDLYHGSPLEDRMWAMLKEKEIPAEREYDLISGRQSLPARFCDLLC